MFGCRFKLKTKCKLNTNYHFYPIQYITSNITLLEHWWLWSHIMKNTDIFENFGKANITMTITARGLTWHFLNGISTNILFNVFFLITMRVYGLTSWLDILLHMLESLILGAFPAFCKLAQCIQIYNRPPMLKILVSPFASGRALYTVVLIEKQLPYSWLGLTCSLSTVLALKVEVVLERHYRVELLKLHLADCCESVTLYHAINHAFSFIRSTILPLAFARGSDWLHCRMCSVGDIHELDPIFRLANHHMFKKYVFWLCKQDLNNTLARHVAVKLLLHDCDTWEDGRW